MSDYESVIGLEVHVQLKTESKIFCPCPTVFGAEPNTHICPVCAGYPGVLPVLNEKVVEGLARTALSLGCRVNRRSVFARKQYFYPDLPKNYQISQYELPLAEGGFLDIETEQGKRRIGIHRIHLEEDAGKLLHAIGARELDYSLVDLNRTGVPLMEIVSEPEMSTPEEAAAYLTTLRTLLRYVGVSDCDMEKGSLRCDANVSIRPAGEKTLGTKAEVKNMNSVKNVRDALAYEIVRQKDLVASGGRVVQETRLWNAAEGATHSMRSKEEAHDYRYFPEPDLVPVELDEKTLERWRATLPELPAARRERFAKDLGLSAYDAGVLTAEKPLADFYEQTLAAFKAEDRLAMAKTAANWVTTELVGRLNTLKIGIEASPVPADHMGELVFLLHAGTISGKTAKTVMDEMMGGGRPAEIVKAKGLVQVEDDRTIQTWVEESLADNPRALQDVKAGKMSALGSLVGAVMKKSGGRANPQTVQRLLRRKLGV